MKLRFYLIAILSLSVFTSTITAQDKAGNSTAKKTSAPIKKKDVFTKNTQEKTGFEGISPEIGILVEYISVDHETASTLLGRFASKAGDAGELRDELELLIDKGNANLVETAWVRARSGQRAKTESVREDYYPTDYDSPEIPNTIGNIVVSDSDKKGGKSSEAKIHMTSAMPSSFDRRNVGTTLEVDPVLSSDHKLIDLNLAPEIVTRLEDDYHIREGFEKSAKGVEHIFMPTFYAIKDTTQIEVAPGKYNLLGIHTPHDDLAKRILVLLRADLISYD